MVGGTGVVRRGVGQEWQLRLSLFGSPKPGEEGGLEEAVGGRQGGNVLGCWETGERGREKGREEGWGKVRGRKGRWVRAAIKHTGNFNSSGTHK